jgi:hypothetical protein
MMVLLLIGPVRLMNNILMDGYMIFEAFDTIYHM